jgi:DNA-nicking Smr family endonuclease
MDYCFNNDNEVMIVDLHNMKVWDAWGYLDRLISFAPKETNEIVVIHGFNNGTHLMKMVRKDYKHKRVISKFSFWNEGRTSLIIS